MTRVAAADRYYWRLVATAGCFALFGFGGLALTTLMFPLLLFLPGETRAHRARWCVHKCFALFMWVIERLGLMRWEVHGAQHLRACGNQLILANHPTLIDVVALLALIPDASCVVKRALWNNPFVSGVVRAAGYISNADSQQVIDDCVDDLRHRHPLVIFPEGTRSVPGCPLHFQRGAAYIALRSARPVLPVLIQCHPSTLTKGAKWYRIPARRFVLRIEVLAPIEVQHWVGAAEPPTLQARRLTHALEAYFTDQLNQHGRTQHAQA